MLTWTAVVMKRAREFISAVESMARLWHAPTSRDVQPSSSLILVTSVSTPLLCQKSKTIISERVYGIHVSWGLFVANTYFQAKEVHNYTWYRYKKDRVGKNTDCLVLVSKNTCRLHDIRSMKGFDGGLTYHPNEKLNRKKLALVPNQKIKYIKLLKNQSRSNIFF